MTIKVQRRSEHGFENKNDAFTDVDAPGVRTTKSVAINDCFGIATIVVAAGFDASDVLENQRLFLRYPL